ncbi:MAG: hypothetical protein HYX55_07960 [Chloroflexi bacterium]|nr:hypothetical protein [Chloroflexota bacterium]
MNHPPTTSNLARSSDCIDNTPSYTQSVVTVNASDPDAGDTLTVRLVIGRIYQNNQYHRLGSYVMTPNGAGLWSFTVTQSMLQGFGWSSSVADSEITYNVTAYDPYGGAPVTLRSHDNDATKLWYRTWSGCQIF